MEYLKEGYKKTNIGIMPNDWKIEQLGSLFSITAGRDLIKGDFSLYLDDEHKIPIYSNSLENKGLYGYTKCPRHKSNSITVTARGTLGKSNARSVDFDAIGRLLVLEPVINLNCFFISEYINEMVKFSVESTGVPQLTVPQISKYFVTIPPIEEQNKIASILSTVDDLIENTDQLTNSYNLLKKGLLQTLLTKGIGHTKFKKTKIGEIPEDWEIKNFCEVIKKDKNRQYNKIFSNHYLKQGKYPIIDQGKDYICGYTNNETDLYSGELPIIIFGDHTRILKYVDIPFAIGADGTQIILPNNKIVDSNFFFYALLNLKIKNQGYQRHYKYLKEFSIPIPNPTEQNKIAIILSSVDKQVDVNLNKKEKLNLLKKGLMQQLLTGKTRVKV